MRKIRFGEKTEVADNEKSPIMLAVTAKGSFVWTHLCGDIDRISPRRFETEAEARKYVLALAEKLKDFALATEDFIQNYDGGKAIETKRVTIIDIEE